MRKNVRKRGRRASYFTHRGLSAVLLALVLAAQAAGCGSTQDAAGDSQATQEAGLTESENSSEETESAEDTAGSEDAADGDEGSTAAGDESDSESGDAASDGDESSDGSGETGETEDSGSDSQTGQTGDSGSEGSDAAAGSESGDASASESSDDTATSESGDDASDAENSDETAELSCQLLYEAVAAEASDGVAMVTEKEECTFLTSKYRELLEDFYYATDPEQVYCVCILKADSEDSAQSIKEEFDDALLSMQNDMYLTTDEQKVAKTGVTGISGQYVWYISLSDDASVMSAAEDALVSKLG